MRAARQVSVEEVASQLILSKAQVLGLEHANAAAFYSTTYFLKALRKYMAFAEVPTAVLDEAMAEAAEGDAEALRLTLADTAPAGLVATRVPGRLWAAAAAVVALAVIALGISKYRPAVTEATGDP
ncbi:MAG: hypothetical protein OEW19_22340, partial [Acidobacteriota bacterium]|nr:hypothetical protein [Acidobacteriota bacterium]